MKKTALTLAATFVWALAVPAQAHGDATPMYGGVVQVVSDLQFELVAQPGGAALYVVDHGQPADASAMGGRLVVLNGTRKTEAALKPAGGNRLDAAGIVVGKGAKAIATVNRPGAAPLTVRFSM
ncbi:hypothetical protein [Rubrivivax gelatinosus]|uniref:Uncharacterized protein n=1 Tax=Rubrivivax gelatinosus TaxID=28068 RepID=A0A4R2MEP0_RUBGE|nr:hypothetical protein [Rubrivivax gelatinosus]MBK1687611.1 hypothetical protein [Rubrivivax gelatinosus]TCP02984.1 hypothetical protein EV684_105150 [Rubrivivax gelatinosus]